MIQGRKVEKVGVVFNTQLNPFDLEARIHQRKVSLPTNIQSEPGAPLVFHYNVPTSSKNKPRSTNLSRQVVLSPEKSLPSKVKGLQKSKTTNQVINLQQQIIIQQHIKNEIKKPTTIQDPAKKTTTKKKKRSKPKYIVKQFQAEKKNPSKSPSPEGDRETKFKSDTHPKTQLYKLTTQFENRDQRIMENRSFDSHSANKQTKSRIKLPLSNQQSPTNTLNNMNYMQKLRQKPQQQRRGNLVKSQILNHTDAQKRYCFSPDFQKLSMSLMENLAKGTQKTPAQRSRGISPKTTTKKLIPKSGELKQTTSKEKSRERSKEKEKDKERFTYSTLETKKRPAKKKKKKSITNGQSKASFIQKRPQHVRSLAKAQLETNFDSLHQEYIKVFNWRTNDKICQTEGDLNNNEDFVTWLKGLPQEYLEKQLTQMQSINDQMNTQGFKYTLSEHEQYQFLEQFLRDKYLKQRNLNKMRNSLSLSKNLKSDIDQRFNELQKRWTQTATKIAIQKSSQRIEINRYYEQILNQAATLIQKNWRGYQIRNALRFFKSRTIENSPSQSYVQEQKEEDTFLQNELDKAQETPIRKKTISRNSIQEQQHLEFKTQEELIESECLQTFESPQEMFQYSEQIYPIRDEMSASTKQDLKSVLGGLQLQKLDNRHQMSTEFQFQQQISPILRQDNFMQSLPSPFTDIKEEQIKRWDTLINQLIEFKQQKGQDLPKRAIKFLTKLQTEGLKNIKRLCGDSTDPAENQSVTGNMDSDSVVMVVKTEKVTQTDKQSQDKEVSKMHEKNQSSRSDRYSSESEVITFQVFKHNISVLLAKREQAFEQKYQKQFELMDKLLENKKISSDSFQRHQKIIDKKMWKEKTQIRKQKTELEKVQQLFKDTIKQTRKDRRLVQKLRKFEHSFKEEDGLSFKQFLSMKSEAELSGYSDLVNKQYNLVEQRQKNNQIKQQYPQNNSISVSQRSHSFENIKYSPIENNSAIVELKERQQQQDFQIDLTTQQDIILTLEDQETQSARQNQNDNINIVEITESPEPNFDQQFEPLLTQNRVDHFTELILLQLIDEFSIELNQLPIQSLAVLMEWDESQELSQMQTKQPQGFPTTLNYVKEILVGFNEFIQSRYMDDFIVAINNPLGIAPLELLKTISLNEIQLSQPDDSESGPLYPLIKHIHMMEPVVEDQVWEEYCQEQALLGKFKFVLNEESQFQEVRDSEITHLRMIYEAFNEALNYIRPYGIRGQPYPWFSNSLKVYQHKTVSINYDKAMSFAIAKMLKWGSTLCGFIPEKIEAPNGQVITIEDDYLNQIREDRLQAMLENEVIEGEEKWLSLEEELTEVNVELADIVFEMMLDEASEELEQIISMRNQ